MDKIDKYKINIDELCKYKTSIYKYLAILERVANIMI